jgi:hypothetical protein
MHSSSPPFVLLTDVYMFIWTVSKWNFTYLIPAVH